MCSSQTVIHIIIVRSCLFLNKMLIILLSFLISNCFCQIIIDSDGGADDVFAISVAALNEKYNKGPKIIAITTCRGNVDENQAYINIQKILQILGRYDIPIYRGFNESILIEYPTDQFFGVDGLGDSSKYELLKPIPAEDMPAPEAIREFSKIYGKDLTVIALGPLTNIALALLFDNDLFNRIGHIYIGAGDNSGNETYPEFNAYMDVEAYYIVMKHATISSVTLVPITSVDGTVTLEWRLKVFGEIDSPIVKSLNVFSQIALQSNETKEYWNFLDPFVAAVACNQEVVKNVTVTENRIYTCGNKRGLCSNNFRAGNESNAKIILDFDGDKFQNYIYFLFSRTVSEC